jgi:uncharacterized protein (TIGR03435 family)
MLRAALILAVIGSVAVVSASLVEQSPPAFEVASVKINTNPSSSSSTRQRASGSFEMINVDLRAMIGYAYDVRLRQIIGAPDWTGAVRFDVLAKAPVDDDGGQMPTMMRSLLADRFRLSAHTERREQPIYALEVARAGRLGPQLAPSTADCSTGQGRSCGLNMTSDSRGTTMQGRAVLLADLAVALAGVVDRVVVDRTGVTGAFDVDLRFTTEGVAGGLAGDAPSVFSAIQEQLGLKLEPSRGPVDVLVIDSVERPTPD